MTKITFFIYKNYQVVRVIPIGEFVFIFLLRIFFIFQIFLIFFPKYVKSKTYTNGNAKLKSFFFKYSALKKQPKFFWYRRYGEKRENVYFLFFSPQRLLAAQFVFSRAFRGSGQTSRVGSGQLTRPDPRNFLGMLT